MTTACSIVFQPLRIVAMAATLLFASAHADEYTDISQLMRAGKLSEAMSKADQYLLARPKDPQLRFLKGVIQRDSGRAMEAIATFTRLTEDYPELPEPYNNLAVLYAGQNQFDQARSSLEMAIRTNPSYSTAHENLGDVYAKLASQAYNKALQLDTANPVVAPKLALIREIFNPTGPKGARPATPATTPAALPAATPSANPAAAPTPASAPPPVPLPTPTPAALPAPVAVKTPPVVAALTQPTPAAVNTNPSAINDAKEAEATVHAWATAWSNKDVKTYLAIYGKEFNPPGSMARGAWEEERKARIIGKSRISVTLGNLNVTVHGSTATAKFRQDYKADGLEVVSRKTLGLVKTGDRWHIVKESTGA